MCLILVALNQHERYPLIIAANRDEFYDRPTREAGFWSDAPDLVAGRDLKSGGTWLGMTRSGAWAAVTNFREPPLPEAAPLRTRGDLVRTYLENPLPAAQYAAEVKEHAQEFAGFSLLLGSRQSVTYISNRDPHTRSLGRGLFGLSNGAFDEAWPKVEIGKKRLDALLRQPRIDAEELLALLGDRTQAEVHELPDTGIGTEREKLLSPAFIAGAEYGTRSSTTIIVDTAGQTAFLERTFHSSGFECAPVDRHFRFKLDAPAY
ncbi:MAG: NRDE family protein [Gammaproteobacteria bacterium]|nr:NRDE family protein [Gammaproteobacteria bacterium]